MQGDGATPSGNSTFLAGMAPLRTSDGAHLAGDRAFLAGIGALLAERLLVTTPFYWFVAPLLLVTVPLHLVSELL